MGKWRPFCIGLKMVVRQDWYCFNLKKGEGPNQPDNSHLEQICVIWKMIYATHYIAEIHFSGDVLGEQFDNFQGNVSLFINKTCFTWQISNEVSLTVIPYNNQNGELRSQPSIPTNPYTVLLASICHQGSTSTWRHRLTSIEIPITNIRWSGDRLIYIIEISVPGKTVFKLRQAHVCCIHWM